MILYVLGFAFNKHNEQVILIKKDHPEWQAGYLNGVGGKINPDEPPAIAMAREFKEETGVEINEWIMAGIMEGVGWKCYCFTCSNDEIYNCETTTSEEIERWVVEDVFYGEAKTINNVPYLLMASLDSDLQNFHLTYK